MPSSAWTQSCIQPCASVEHLPTELWEVRHVKYGIIHDERNESGCERKDKGLGAVLVTPNRTRGESVLVNGVSNPLPRWWAEALQRKVRGLLSEASA